MGTPEQWVEVFVSGGLLFGLMYVFLAAPANEETKSPRARFARIMVLVFGSFGSGIIQAFGLHATFCSGLLWIFSASVVGMLGSGIMVRCFAKRDATALAAAATK